MHGLLIPQARHVRVAESAGVGGRFVTARRTTGGSIAVAAASELLAVAPRGAVGFRLGRRGVRIGLFDTLVPLRSTVRSAGVGEMSPFASFSGLGAVALAAGFLLRFGAMPFPFVLSVGFRHLVPAYMLPVQLIRCLCHRFCVTVNAYARNVENQPGSSLFEL